MYHVCMYVYYMLRRSKEGVGSPETGVEDICEPPYGCWETDLGPLGKQQLPLTTEPPIWVCRRHFYSFMSKPPKSVGTRRKIEKRELIANPSRGIYKKQS